MNRVELDGFLAEIRRKLGLKVTVLEFDKLYKRFADLRRMETGGLVTYSGFYEPDEGIYLPDLDKVDEGTLVHEIGHQIHCERHRSEYDAANKDDKEAMAEIYTVKIPLKMLDMALAQRMIDRLYDRVQWLVDDEVGRRYFGASIEALKWVGEHTTMRPTKLNYKGSGPWWSWLYKMAVKGLAKAPKMIKGTPCIEIAYSDPILNPNPHWTAVSFADFSYKANKGRYRRAHRRNKIRDRNVQMNDRRIRKLAKKRKRRG